MFKGDNIRKAVGVILIIFLIILSYILVKPILAAIIWGLIFAYIFYPLYKKINKIIKNKSLSALIIVLIILAIIMLLLWFLTPIFIKQSFNIYNYIQNLDWAKQIQELFPGLKEQVSKDFLLSINNFIGKIANIALNSFVNIIIEFPKIVLYLFIGSLTFFFVLRDGDQLVQYAKEISPLTKESGKKFFVQFKNITKSIVYGQVIVGLVQGIACGIGLLIFGVPNALLLTLVAIILAVFPIIGPMLVWIPASIYLALSGNLGAGIGLAVYGIIVVSWIDNVTRAILVTKRVKMHPLLIWIGMMGGLLAFGILGLVLGPLIIAYLIIVLDFYKKGKFEEIFAKPK